MCTENSVQRGYHQALTENLPSDIVYLHPDIAAAAAASDSATVLSIIHITVDTLSSLLHPVLVVCSILKIVLICVFSVDRNKYQIHIPLPPKIDPTVTMMQVTVVCIM